MIVHRRTIMYMNVQEFRSTMKEQLDASVRGEKVIITRGGIDFHITAFPKGTSATPFVTLCTHPPTTKHPVHPPEPTVVLDNGVITFCPNGHPMAADGRSCLGKKCKYAQ